MDMHRSLNAYCWMRIIVAAATTGALAGAAQAALVADLGADYRITAPKTGWQYLKSTAASGGTETALTYGGAVGTQGNIGYGGGQDGFNLPCVLGTASSGAFKLFADGGNDGVLGTDLLIHPANTSPQFVIMRYTVSASDVANGTVANIAGSFRRSLTAADGVWVYVFKNTTQLFYVPSGGALSQAAGTFNLSTTVAAGDTISFVLGPNTSFGGDESAVRGTVSLSPTAPTAIVADLGADYRITTPKAGWQYLKSTAASGGTESALTYGSTVGNQGNIGYGGGGNGVNLPCVLGTASTGTFRVFTDGGNGGVLGTDLLLHPGDNVNLAPYTTTPFVIMRYTISAADAVYRTPATIAGSFRRALTGGDGVAAYVFKNTTQLFYVPSGGALSQAAGTFYVDTTVSPGDTVSFALGKNGDLFGDESAVRGTISIPEASVPRGTLIILR